MYITFLTYLFHLTTYTINTEIRKMSLKIYAKMHKIILNPIFQEDELMLNEMDETGLPRIMQGKLSSNHQSIITGIKCISCCPIGYVSSDSSIS